MLGKAIRRKALSEVYFVVTPDIILRGHRGLVAQKYDGSKSRSVGRPRVIPAIRKLVIRMATDDCQWGYERIEGELRKDGHRVARTTVATILREHGFEPAPLRSKRTTWAELLDTHWVSIAAMDFCTVEASTPQGLTRFHVLFVIDLATRRGEVVGISYRHADGINPSPIPNTKAEGMSALSACALHKLKGSHAGHDVGQDFGPYGVDLHRRGGVANVRNDLSATRCRKRPDAGTGADPN